MTLKQFFERLVSNGLKVDIYYHDEPLNSHCGFKINNINSIDIEKNIIREISEEITDCYLDSDDYHSMEGNTNYSLKPDQLCVKSAEYFSTSEESWQYWLENHDTNFHFETNFELPFHCIEISKQLDQFNIHSEKKLAKILSKKTLRNFRKFYFDLIKDFQNIELELEIFQNDYNEYYFYVSKISGSYTEEIEFKLLDDSLVEFSVQDLKEMLIESFRLDGATVNKI